VSLVDLYRQMAALTNSVCATCSPPYHCCEDAGCAQAMAWTETVEQVNLIADKTHLPFLEEDGCILPPHYRPLCSIWLCKDAVRPPGYAELLREIADAERERLR
jgi:hypothetical protein